MIERVTPEARRALLGSAVGYAMDGFDLLILSFLLRPIAAAFHLRPPQSAALVTATLVGAILGGVVFGVLADRFGRVRVLAWTILLFAVFTGLCGLASSYVSLMLFRGIAGLGLGGELGIGMALVAEAWPASMRARVSSYVGLRWQAGVLAAALVTPALLPLIGWRGMFGLGVVPAVAAFVIRRRLREPELFLGARPVRPLRLFTGAGVARISIGMVVLCSVQNFGYYGVMIWLPNYLSVRFGYGLTQSSLWTAVTIAGMAIGIAAFGQVADRFGRRPTFLAWMAGAAIMVVVYAALTSPAGPAGGRRGDGVLRQWHAGRLRRADERTVSDRTARHGAERAVQYRPRRGRVRAGGGGLGRGAARIFGGDCRAGSPVCAGHGGAVGADPGAARDGVG